MIKIDGYNINNLPFEELKKVSDLIEFDGPLLSHYKDKFSNNLLFYWVDNDEVNNRWIVWKISEDFLYLYLNEKISLVGLFPEGKEFVYVVDIDKSVKYSNIVMIYASGLPHKYKPEVDAFFKFELRPSPARPCLCLRP